MPPACAFANLPFTPERILAGLRGEAAVRRKPRCRCRAPQPPTNTWQNPFAGRRGAFASRRGIVRRRGRHRRGRAAVAGDRADRAAGPVDLFGGHHRPRPAARRARRLRGLPHRDGGAINAGGRAIETPFGTIYATNITPDVETGIGAWSYPAFERAMREGIHRDGRHLYPAFPYTHFAKTSDADLQALYAYLMAQPAVRAETPANKLAFPFNLRPLMAGWNALFHHAATLPARRDQIGDWNRGAYLVEGLGHCGACHSPRNALGAEKAERLSRRRFCRGLGSAAADLAVACADPVERRRAVRLSADRRVPLSRRRRRTDGAGREGTRRRCPTRTSAPWRSISPPSTKPRPDKPAQDALAAKLEKPTATRVVCGIASPARGSMKAPARSAMRSAARRCSAAGRRWR